MSLLNKFSFLVFVLAILIVQYGCAPTVTQNTTVGDASYEEDLSIHRKTYPIPEDQNQSKKENEILVQKERAEPSNHIKSELDSVLTKIVKSRENINYIDGLTIQVYSGNNREMANTIKKQLYKLSDTFSPVINYDQPNYKVSVGEYFTRLEANKDYNFLRKEFSQALLVPKKISIQSNN
ncbi:MAG: hypothetical protein ACJA2S_005019 [Cyclobacteriaceae bacterium]